MGQRWLWVQALAVFSVHIYDANTWDLLRTYNLAHNQSIALAWNSHVLTSGSLGWSIIVMCGKRPTGLSRGVRDKQEVSGDGGPQSATLASGGNDNEVCIWDLRGTGCWWRGFKIGK